MINGLDVNVASESLDMVGVVACPTCDGRPCRNGGLCRAAATDHGYQCSCQRGYSGSDCELIGKLTLPSYPYLDTPTVLC